MSQETDGALSDSVELDVEGVNLTPNAVEEPLLDVAESCFRAVEAMASGSGLADVSLPQSGLEILFHHDTKTQNVSVSIASLARPARLIHRGVQVPWNDFAHAVADGATRLAKRVAPLAPERCAMLLSKTKRLSQPTTPRKPQRMPPVGFGYWCAAPNPFSFAFALHDPDELFSHFHPNSANSLASLVCSGNVTLRTPGAKIAYKTPSPFLFALECARQAGEIARGTALHNSRQPLFLGGLPPNIAHEDAQRLARAICEFGLELAFAIESHHPLQRKNPYLQELKTKCQEGLFDLAPRATSRQTAVGRSPGRKAPSKPLNTPGSLRRLRFVPQWEQPVVPFGREGFSRVVLDNRSRAWVHGLDFAHRLDRSGEIVARYFGGQGVAWSEQGWVVCAETSRLLAFSGDSSRAVWMRDHDGLPLGPTLDHAQGVLFTESEARTAVALSAATGRELWRFSPPRATQLQMARLGGRTIITTDAGFLYGLETINGTLRYRFEAPMAFAHPAVEQGKRFVSGLNQGDRSAWVAASLEQGTLAWTHEAALSAPSEPAVLGPRLFILGNNAGKGRVLALSRAGKVHLNVELPFAAPAYWAKPFRGGLNIEGAGNIARIAANGALQFHLSPTLAGWETHAVTLARGIVFVLGPTLRMVDAISGRELGEMALPKGRNHIAVDRRLTLYVLSDTGRLSAYALASHFSVLR
ncbi:MAG: PQQ-binding-like beta-propeller repeat protein [Myxococcaceae bacterium]